MAKGKELAKPLFSVKHDFVESLDAFLQQSINLLQAVERTLDLSKGLEKPLADHLRERATAFRAALMSDSE